MYFILSFFSFALNGRFFRGSLLCILIDDDNMLMDNNYISIDNGIYIFRLYDYYIA